MACGCKGGGGSRNRPAIGPRSINGNINALSAQNVAAQTAAQIRSLSKKNKTKNVLKNPSNLPLRSPTGLTKERRALEKKRRDIILSKLGRA